MSSEEPQRKPAPSSRDTDDEPSPESYVIKKPRLWPIPVALLVIAAGVAAFLFFHFRGKVEPLRVLVMIEYEGGYAWEGSKASAALSDEICDLLKKVGFDPVKIGDPEVDKVLAKATSPEDAAKSFKAAFVVSGSLKPTLIDEKLPAGARAPAYVEARVDATLTVRQTQDPAGQVSTAPIAAWSGALEKDEAIRLLQKSLVDQVFEATASRLMAHPTIVEILKGSDVAAMGQIGDARQYMELRKARLDVAARAYEKVISDLKSTAPGTARKINYLTPADEEDSLVATSPEGFLVRVEKATRTVSPHFAEMEFLENLEDLGWRANSAAADPPKSIWRGYHVYGRPGVGRDGTVVIIEDMFKFAKAIAKKTPDGWKRVRIDPTGLYSNLHVSPKGDALAVWSTCKGCEGHLTLVNLADGLSIFERSEDEVNYGFTWLDDKRLAFLVKPPKSTRVILDRPPGKAPGAPGLPEEEEASGIELRTFNLKTHEEVTVGRFPENEGFAAPVASPDGSLIAVQHALSPKEHVLALIDTKTGTLTDVPAAVSGAWPAFSPDGKLVVYTEHDDLRLLHLEDKRVEPLTDNPLLEQNPMFSADGSEVYFEILDKDPVAPRRHVQIIASVKVAP